MYHRDSFLRRRRRRRLRGHDGDHEEQRNKLNRTIQNFQCLVPALVWLSLAGIVFHEKSTLLMRSCDVPNCYQGVFVLASSTFDSQKQQQQQQQHKQHAVDRNGGDLIIMEDGSATSTSGAAVEVLTYNNHHHHDPSSLNERKEEEKTDGDNDDHTKSVERTGVIVAVAVDGTLAGISKKDGKVLWKKQSKDVINMNNNNNSNGSTKAASNHPLSSYSSSASKAAAASCNPTLDDDADSFLMQPLVSTTTTTKSASSSNYAAVPSVDGTVFTTSNEVTVSSSVKDLVGRAPFLDPKGRFYVGSRHATAAALDRDTGEILRVIATPSHRSNKKKQNSGDDGDDRDDDKSHEDGEVLPDLHGRNVVWIGRVDYHVSVQDARTGMMEAQFSVAEVMSVTDMHGMTEKVAWRKRGGMNSNGEGSGATNEAEQNIVHRLGLPASENPFEALAVAKSIIKSVLSNESDDESAVIPATLVATPNGNVGFWDYETNCLSWIADETFDTPIAFAMDADTGLRIDVDLIPDVPDPTVDRDSIAREMERQLEIPDQDNDQPDEQTIVGAMTNGQLFALPLGRRAVRASSPGRTTTGSFAHKSTIARTSNHKTQGHPVSVSHLPGRSSASNTLPAETHNQKLLEMHAVHQNSIEAPPLSAKKACAPSSPAFPGCLVKDRADSHHHHHHHSSSGGYNFIPKSSRSGYKPTSDIPSKERAASDRYQHLSFDSDPSNGIDRQDSIALLTNHFRSEDGGFYHPEYGYVSPQDLHRAQQQRYGHRKSTYRMLWALFSWMGPSLLTAFVIAFELGRRKRAGDEKTSAQDPKQQEITSSDNSREDVQTPLAPASMLDLSSVQDSQTLQQQHVIKVSDEILGYGAQGTVVYKGVLDGREVAVKRMLKAYHANADREISLLIESDGDPNVVRYFLKEARGDFVYLALELCDLSLHDLIGVLRDQRQNVALQTPPDPQVIESTQRVLFQIASGVKHLHFQCRIVHRDLKPANILLAISKRGKKKVKKGDHIIDTFLNDYYDAKISDMGLGKQLRGQSSLGASLIGESSLRGSTTGRANSIGIGPGSVGWQAPEVMALRPTSDMSTRSNDSANTGHEGKNDLDTVVEAPTNPRTSRSVDIFSLGCIFYSVLLPQLSHPYGEWYEREANIMHNKPNLSPLKSISTEAFYLIQAMLERDPKRRPSAKGVCEHPFFWSSHKKLIFLCDVSDRLETECSSQSTATPSSLSIERGAMDVVGTSWESRLDHALVDNVNKFRTYDYACIRDLLRLIRNKHHHFEELPEDFRKSTVPDQEALFEYFQRKFPDLVMHCYNFCRQNFMKDDALLSKYEIVPFPKIDVKAQEKVNSASPVAIVVEQMNNASTQEIDTYHNDHQIDDNDEVEMNETSGEMQENNHLQDDDFSPPKTSITPILIDEQDEKTDSATLTTENHAVVQDAAVRSSILTAISDDQDDIVVWEGSTAANAFNCRGWSRAQDEWSRRIEPCYKKRDANLKRCVEDPKFRTRLCNHWDISHGTDCPMRRKGKCVFAHGPAELRVKEGKKNRWGRLVDKNGNNKNPWHSGGEDTFGAATSIEKVRKEEGKWTTNNVKSGKNKNGISSSASSSTNPPKKHIDTTGSNEGMNGAKSSNVNAADEQESTEVGQVTKTNISLVQIKENFLSEDCHGNVYNTQNEKEQNGTLAQTEDPADE